MITIKVEDKQLHQVHADGYVFFCEQGVPLTPEQQEWAAAFYPNCQAMLEQSKFGGSQSSSCIITGSDKSGRPVQLIFVGLGARTEKPEQRVEYYRRAVGKIIRSAECKKITNLALPFLHAYNYHLDDCDLAKETMIVLEMAVYNFQQFITDKNRHTATDYTITICAPEGHHDAINVGVAMGTRIGFAVNQARHWCDLPADILTPSHLAEQAQKVAQPHDNLKCKVFTQAECAAMGMGGLVAVASGSKEEAKFVILEYTCEHKDAPTIGLVGKGVTFDSGGLGIKPAGSMEDMKDDMAGAAAVISTMQAIAYLKPKVNVVGIAPITENMTGGGAFKPGDILSHYNGVTSEIKHTDAEGRLILADALSYMIQHYKPDALVNAATLTGACSHALGPFYAGMMTQHEQFGATLMACAHRCGDHLWSLPFHDDYRPAVVSDVADIRNTGKTQYRAGATTAGFFLAHFVDKNTPWIHLDIAGVSYAVPDRSYYRPMGATGFGVRLFIDMLMNWSKN